MRSPIRLTPLTQRFDWGIDEELERLIRVFGIKAGNARWIRISSRYTTESVNADIAEALKNINDYLDEFMEEEL